MEETHSVGQGTTLRRDVAGLVTELALHGFLAIRSSSTAAEKMAETLEKMTQDMETLKKDNTEKDQQWRRPPLPEDFNEMTQNLVFQQIEAEEGVLNGGKTTVKLFGVTEVSNMQTAYVTLS